MNQRAGVVSGAALILIMLLVLALNYSTSPKVPEGIALGNGRIEAKEFDIATKYAGRLRDVFVQEGDMVSKDEVLATMDVDTMEAELRQAQAQLKQMQRGREYALAIVRQRESEKDFAAKELLRSENLIQSGHVSKEKLDQDKTAGETAEAALIAARIKVEEAEAAVEAAQASVDRLNTEINDSRLSAPIEGRVLYRLAEPGEVLPAGGKILTLLDFSDIYMTIFLPATEVGRIAIGSEAIIIFDAAPEYRVPAQVSFVSPRAQFTPKEVETRDEREKLMFRVKLRIAPELISQYIERVKTGVTGVGYVRLDDEIKWPEHLETRLPLTE